MDEVTQLFRSTRSKEDRPPAGREAKPKPPQGLERQLASIQAQLETLIGTVVLSLSLVDPVDAQIVANGAPRLIESVVRLARQDERVRKYLVAASRGSAWIDVGISVASIAIPIAVHHGWLPNLPFVSVPGASSNGQGAGVDTRD